MAVLLTGGTGKTSLRIARFLQDAKIPFLLASRKAKTEAPAGMPAINFDWLDSSTFKNPFQYQFPGGESISAVYLIAPTVQDPNPSMTEFIDFAVKNHGVKRFVFLTGSLVVKGRHSPGKLWQHLDDIGVEYCVLLATWFMENFSEEWYLKALKEEGKLYTACGDAKIPFVSATDIAAVAFRTLVDEKSHNTYYRVLGPELLTYDQIAMKFSSGLGREIVNVKLSEEQSAQQHMKIGNPEHYAKFLASLETASAHRIEITNDVVKRVTGQPPQTFDAWIQENKMAWQ